MMRWNSLLGTLVFGGLSALGLPAVWLGLGPWLGGHDAAALYLVAVGWLYGVGLAPNPRSAVAVGLGSGLLGGALLFAARDLVEVAFGAALLIALFRSVCVERGHPLRTVFVEGLLGIGGLGVASAVAAPGPVGLSLALWSYFLVQSTFYLIGGWRARSGEPGMVDPFDRARGRLLELLEEG